MYAKRASLGMYYPNKIFQVGNQHNCFLLASYVKPHHCSSVVAHKSPTVDKNSKRTFAIIDTSAIHITIGNKKIKTSVVKNLQIIIRILFFLLLTNTFFGITFRGIIIITLDAKFATDTIFVTIHFDHLAHLMLQVYHKNSTLSTNFTGLLSFFLIYLKRNNKSF